MDKIQYFQMEVKEVEIKSKVIKIKGFASTPDIDRCNDIVDPKAFKSSIEQYMQNPVILLQHDANKPIGKAISYKISKNGLYIEAEIHNNIDNVFENITNGIFRTFSIGFIPKKWKYEQRGDIEVRIIEDLDLIENSIVTTPANGQALFTLSKSIKAFFDNLQTNQEVMDKNEKMTAEEIQNAPVVELEGEELLEAQEETEKMDAEKSVEGTNPEVLEEVESADESSAETDSETIETEVATQEEVATEEVTDQTNEEKSLDETKAMKKELSEIKASVSELKETNASLTEALELSIKTIVELKEHISRIPVRKGLVSLGWNKQESKLHGMLENIKNNNI